MGKKRLDELLVNRNLADNIEKARRLVMAGVVFSKQERLDKPGMQLDENTDLWVKEKRKAYVGRGGLKMEKALKYFRITAKDKIFMDVGSSTGGFTDCALQHGANLSYAIDVGYNQLDWKLRSNERVVVMERTNFRYVTPEMLEKGKPELAAIDVSFISLELMLPVMKTLLQDESDVVVLIKPQFEASKEEVGEGGIVRSKQVHLAVIRKIIQFAEHEGFVFHDLTYSPITGSEGNIEFLAHFSWRKEETAYNSVDVESIVNEAHSELKR